MLGFLAYEGFELIANASNDIIDPKRTLPIAFLGSVIAGVLPGFLAGRLDMSLEQADPSGLALWVGPILCCVSLLPRFGADAGRVAVQAGGTAAKGRAPLGLLAFWAVTVFLASMGEGAIRTFYTVYLDAHLNVPPATIGLVMGVAHDVWGEI